MAYRTEFAQEVRKALAGRPYRQISAKVEDGLSPAYIADMVQGRVPTEATLKLFADACGVDPDPLLRAAGYMDDEAAAAEREWKSGIQALEQTHGEFPVPSPLASKERPTRDETRRDLAALEELLEKLGNVGGTGGQSGPSGSGKIRPNGPGGAGGLAGAARHPRGGIRQPQPLPAAL